MAEACRTCGMLCTESTARVRCVGVKVGGSGGWGSGGAGGENAPRVETATPRPPPASAGAVFDVAEAEERVARLVEKFLLEKAVDGSENVSKVSTFRLWRGRLRSYVLICIHRQQA
jgi:hypothetical protein